MTVTYLKDSSGTLTKFLWQNLSDKISLTKFLWQISDRRSWKISKENKSKENWWQTAAGHKKLALACDFCDITLRRTTLKAHVSQKILNWHSLWHSHSAEICILFYCLSWLRQARQRKMIQNSALWLCLRLCHFKISWDT